MYRYDLARTNYTKTEPLRKLTGQKWEYSCGAKSGFGCSPVVAEDTVFLLSKDGYLHAVEVSDGKPKWKYRATLPSEAILANP
jgi:outer membrane protein assembly factor BamB